MQITRIVHYENKRASGFVTVDGYRYYSHELDNSIKDTVVVEVSFRGPNCYSVNIYMNGAFFCEAVRPNIFDVRALAPTKRNGQLA